MRRVMPIQSSKLLLQMRSSMTWPRPSVTADWIGQMSRLGLRHGMGRSGWLRNVDRKWQIVSDHTSVPFYMDGSYRAAVDLQPT